MNTRDTRDRGFLLSLGALSLWPVIYMGLFFVFMFATMGGGSAAFDLFPIVFAVHGATAVLSMILVVGYAVHALTDRRLPTQERLLWGILLFVGNILAVPAYWYLRVWKRSPEVAVD